MHFGCRRKSPSVGGDFRRQPKCKTCIRLEKIYTYGFENNNVPFIAQCPLLQFVMHDYGTRLFDGITKCRRVQSSAMQFLLTHRFVSILFTFIFVYFR